MFICVQLEYHSSETYCYHLYLLLQSQCLNKKKKVWIERKTSVFTWVHRVITKLLCNLSFQKYYFGYKNKKCFELRTNWWDGQFVMPILVFKTLRLLLLMFPTVLLLQILDSPTKLSPHVMLQWLWLEKPLLYSILSGRNSGFWLF